MPTPTLTHEHFPKQGAMTGRTVEVVFDYDTDHPTTGEIVRSDEEAPYRTIIRLVGGRYVMGTECQYRLV